MQKVLQDTGCGIGGGSHQANGATKTCLLWDKTTGKPLHNAIVWQDRRTLCNQLAQGYASQSAIALAGPRRLFFRD